VLVYWDFHGWGLFLCPSPFLWGRFSVPSATPCYQCVMTVHCLFFNFEGHFDFLCCLLAREISSVICYLPCFSEWLIAHPPPAPALGFPAFPALVYQLLTLRLAPCFSPFLQCTFIVPTPSAVVLHCSSLFFVQFFCGGRPVCPGAVLVYPKGGWWNSA
jgi:hypothetical protein